MPGVTLENVDMADMDGAMGTAEGASEFEVKLAECGLGGRCKWDERDCCSG